MNIQHLNDLNILAKTPEPHKPATPGIWRASIVHILKHMHNFDIGNICTLPKRFRVGEKSGIWSSFILIYFHHILLKMTSKIIHVSEFSKHNL